MWFNVWQAVMAGGYLWLYYYWNENVNGGDIYLPPMVRTCDFSDVGC